MIYEKRGQEIPRVRREDMAAGDRIPLFCTPCVRESSLPSENKSEGQPETPSKRKTKGQAKRFALTVIGIVLSFFILDAKFFDSVYTNNFTRLVKQGAQSLSNVLAQEDAVKSDELHGRTLYTLSYSDDGETDNTLQNDTEIAEHQDKSTGDSVAADSTFSENYADGDRLFPITSLDLSAPAFLSLNNETSFSPDMEQVLRNTPTALMETDAHDGPKVLILHTHGTESYTQNTDMYPESEETRSTDIQNNIVRTGEEIARTLSDFGIESIHCNTMHDESSFINAYSYSAKTVKKYLEEYPSVKFVIDVHRDAIIRDDGESIRTVTNIAGEDYAQIMFVVGTNEQGHNHPDWQDNLSLAARLQKEIGETYPALCRSINLRKVPFNQQLSAGYLLLEIGTSANTLQEALRSARAFGENLARVILKR